MKIAPLATKKTRRILGIDPGTNILGYAVLESIGNKQKVLTIGIHKTPRNGNHAEKLKSIFDVVQSLIVDYKINECALESPFFGKNVQSMLKLGRAQGVAMAAAISQDVTVDEYAPKKVKQSVTGNGNASKEQVSSMLKHMYTFDHTKLTLDATDALGVAVCHLNQKKNGLTGSTSYNGWKQFVEMNPDRKKK